ncbi:polysaccharide biosynthesis/export family protein [Schlesneria paludicola]|uniref:polysaccharide biosynthesis/export family protein n=1 Tax=Schlesneria paludicola TaxID=360056 RepID=UPI00138AE7C1|nr:polysaccharide biosynthesis/export family protein [Schlesneria paludicola]
MSLASVGCATVRGEKYTYNNLPKHLIAGVRENPQTIELSKLASATTDSDVLDHGDVVEVSIAAGLNEKDTIRIPVRINDEGDVELPEIGRVHVAGMKVTAAEATIVQECISRGLYRSPSVTMLMKQQRTNRIMVAGAVKKPSVYELPRGQSDLLSALSKAEGLDPTAGTQVIIRNMGHRSGVRPDAIASGLKNGIDTIGHSVEMTSKMHETSDTIKVDLVSATKNGTGGYQLEDGAVVYVEKRDPEPLHVIGLVTRPGRFEFPIAEELRVTDAIALAGGVSSMAADKIFVIRRKPSVLINKTVDPENPDNVETILIQVSLANAKQKANSNIRLAPGDVVSVEQTPVTVILELFKRTSMNFGGSIPLLGSPIF